MRKLLLLAGIGVSDPAFADDIVRLTMRDLAVQTHKWDGKTIETSAYCFYADVNEFRCLWPGGARVDFTELEPSAARDRIEKNCDTVAKTLSRACLTKLQFVYDSFDSLPSDSGTSIHIVIAKDNKGSILAK